MRNYISSKFQDAEAEHTDFLCIIFIRLKMPSSYLHNNLHGHLKPGLGLHLNGHNPYTVEPI